MTNVTHPGPLIDRLHVHGPTPVSDVTSGLKPFKAAARLRVDVSVQRKGTLRDILWSFIIASLSISSTSCLCTPLLK